MTLRACELSDNGHALVAGRGNEAALALAETRLCRNAALWFGIARPVKVRCRRYPARPPADWPTALRVGPCLGAVRSGGGGGGGDKIRGSFPRELTSNLT